MKLKSIALAAGAVCAMASASAATIVINTGGGSATRATTTNVVVESVCGAAASTSVFRNATNVTRIVCPTAIFGGADTLDFSYDNTTGSYLGVGPVSGNGQTTARVDTATCGAGVAEVIGGKSVTAFACTGNLSTANGGNVRPGIGNPDVEPEMFQQANIGALPPVNFAGIDQFSGQYGVIFGVVVSEKLFRDLQTDQGLAFVSLTDEASAPSLSRAQIASLATNNGGPLNTSWAPLFKNAPVSPALANGAVRFVRRVAGSGTQTSFNANFLNYLCSPRGTLPAAAADSTPTYIVNEQGSTGNLLGQVTSTTAYNIGIASRENTPGGTTPNYGFIKIDGTYPSKANVQAGRYNWMAEQTLVLRAGFSANEKTMFDKLVALTASPTVINGFSAAAKNGTVALPFIADAADPFYATHATHYRTFGNSCVVPTSAE